MPAVSSLDVSDAISVGLYCNALITVDAIYFCFEHDLPKDALQQGILKLHFRE